MRISSFARQVSFAVGTTLCLSVLAPAAQAAGFGGAAANYNVFTFGDMTAKWTDAEGRVAIGGDANLSLAVGSGLQDPNAEDYSLVVGGDLDYRYSQVFYEDVAVGGSSYLEGANVREGTVQQATPIDFGAARSFYQDLSTQLNGLERNGSTTYHNWGGIELDGMSGLSVFDLDGTSFSNTNSFTIRGTTDTTAVINVTGEQVSLGGFQMFLEGGIQKENVLFNFVEATDISSSGMSWQGSVLATSARYEFNNGHINGQMIANEIEGNGEYHDYRFAGQIPTFTMNETKETGPKAVPEPSMLAGSLLILGLGAGRKLKGRRNAANAAA